jgi:hypothetical protein
MYEFDVSAIWSGLHPQESTHTFLSVGGVHDPKVDPIGLGDEDTPLICCGLAYCLPHSINLVLRSQPFEMTS